MNKIAPYIQRIIDCETCVFHFDCETCLTYNKIFDWHTYYKNEKNIIIKKVFRKSLDYVAYDTKVRYVIGTPTCNNCRVRNRKICFSCFEYEHYLFDWCLICLKKHTNRCNFCTHLCFFIGDFIYSKGD